MMTAKASIVLILAYILALAAGTTSGVLAERLRTAPQSSEAPLAAELGLNPSQCEQIRKVWEGVSTTVDGCYQQAQAITQQRDNALYAILTDEQKAKFATMDKQYARQFADLFARRQAAFREGLTRTQAMLNDSQRATYEQIVRQRLGGAWPMSEATTQPSVEDVRP